MKIASYNVHKCRGTDGLVRPSRIIEVIREINADLIALQEIDPRFVGQENSLDVAVVQRETGMQILAQSDYPDRHGWHGNALLVRGEPRSYQRSRLRLPGFEPRSAIIAELDLGEGSFRVMAAHLGLLRRSRVEQANAILTAFNQFPPMRTILLGDLNEWRRRRRSALQILEPTFGPPPGILSFPSRRPLFPLDCIFGWPLGLVTDLAVHDSPLARRASDHLPLTASVRLVVKPKVSSAA